VAGPRAPRVTQYLWLPTMVATCGLARFHHPKKRCYSTGSELAAIRPRQTKFAFSGFSEGRYETLLRAAVLPIHTAESKRIHSEFIAL
jgi:hypothetical protein